MFFVLMYHRIKDPSQKASLQDFENHLLKLKQQYRFIVPGETVAKGTQAICLTFDDAYFDFYHDVYPILMRHRIPAVLGIPTQFIIDHTDVEPGVRLSVPYPEGLRDQSYSSQVPFCTWSELREMVDSGLVVAASHSHSHPDLTQAGISIENELLASKKLLAERLSQPIDTFIYPFGRMNKKVHQSVRQYYKYGLRIGNAINYQWQQANGLIYRLDADPFWTGEQDLKGLADLKYYFNHWANRLRGR